MDWIDEVQRGQRETAEIDAETERWVRRVVRLGSKAGKGWYRCGSFAFRRLRANTYQVKNIGGVDVVARGDSPESAYADIMHYA